MTVKKKFTHEGIEFRIVVREETYMNSGGTILTRRVLAPNGKMLPVNFGHRETLKGIVEKSIQAIDNFKSMGADIIKECTK